MIQISTVIFIQISMSFIRFCQMLKYWFIVTSDIDQYKLVKHSYKINK